MGKNFILDGKIFLFVGSRSFFGNHIFLFIHKASSTSYHSLLAKKKLAYKALSIQC